MSARDVRLYQATSDAQVGLDAGFGARYSVTSAAEHHAVDAVEVSLLVLEKIVECGRARAAVVSMRESDDAK